MKPYLYFLKPSPDSKSMFLASAFVFCILCALHISSTFASAALAPEALREAQRRQDHVQQQMEEQRRLLGEDFLKGTNQPPAAVEVPTLPHVPEEAGAPCLQVDKVAVSGVTLISSSTLAVLTAPYTGRCLSLADMNNLLRDITNSYIARGWITARAFVDPGSQEAGALKVMVLEGKIEKIILNGGDKNSYYRGRMAFPGLEGSPLNLRDIEQGLDQLNRLPSSNATMELQPGQEPGGVVVQVTDKPVRTWRAGLGFDNSGQYSTGQYQYSLSFEKDNLMGLGDQFAVYWSEDARPLEDAFQTKPNIGGSNALSAFASVPWGYWTFSFEFSRSTYYTSIFGMNTDYRSSGTTRTTGLRAERVIHRNALGKTSLAVFYTNRDVDNYIERVRLFGSSYKQNTVGTALSHTRRIWGGVLGGDVEYIRGVPWFGTKEIKEDGYLVPKTEFDKFVASLSWYRPFTVGEQNFYWNTTARGQFADKTLYGAERLQIGGRWSVRGFQEDSISGEKGAYARNELGWSLPWFESLRGKGPINGWQLYAAYDCGFIQPDKHDPYERGTMQGAAVGLRSLGDLSLDVSVGKPLDHPTFVRSRDTEFYASVKYTF